MAKSAKSKTRDKFHVGQTVALVLDKSTGFERLNGQLATVILPRVYGEWKCSDPESSRPAAVCEEWRYTVRCAYEPRWHVSESMLRPIYDGEKLSTWQKFAKVTGLRLDKELVPVKVRRPKSTA